MRQGYARSVSERARTRLLVGLAAIVAAAAVVGGTILQTRGAESSVQASAPRPAVDPDSPAALAAETREHPEMAPGRPPFVANIRVPRALAGRKLSAALPVLERRAERGGARDWLLYGSFLQRAGRPVSASRAFDRAVRLAPTSVDARTASAVGHFTKDDPSRAFSQLGPLARAHPRAQVVRYHLGLMLLWIRQVKEAQRQLELAEAVSPRSFYGREASRLLRSLQGI